MDTREIAKEYRLSHWAGIMQERIASGVSIKAYCRTAGICENVYYYWQRKLREAACQEMPCSDEYDEAWRNLEKAGFCVDYIITHTAPVSIIKQFRIREDELPLNNFLEEVMLKAKYKKWCFGHVHDDLDIDGKHCMVYGKRQTRGT